MILCNKCKHEKPDIEYLEANGRIRKNQKSAPLALLHSEEMAEVYVARERISNLTGIQHHVEHVVPLSGEKSIRPICGLHVPWNVSLASAALNMSKGAKFSGKDAERVGRDQMAWLKARGLAVG
jgi:hypothetical protein